MLKKNEWREKMSNIWDGKAIEIWKNEKLAIVCGAKRIASCWGENNREINQNNPSWRKVAIMGNQQSAKEPKPNLSTLGAVSSIRSSRKPRVPKDSRIIGSNNIFTEHHGEFRDSRRFETDFFRDCTRLCKNIFVASPPALRWRSESCSEPALRGFGSDYLAATRQNWRGPICVIKLHEFIISHYRNA